MKAQKLVVPALVAIGAAMIARFVRFGTVAKMALAVPALAPQLIQPRRGGARSSRRRGTQRKSRS